MNFISHQINSWLVVTYYSDGSNQVAWFADETMAREASIQNMSVHNVTYSYVCKARIRNSSSSLKHRFEESSHGE